MSRFLAKLRTEEYDELQGLDIVLAPLPYESQLLGCVIELMPGYLTDWASVPRLPLMFMMFGGKGKKAAGIHDLLYHSQAVPREMADRVLREALIACCYSEGLAWAFYNACRIGGQKRWDEPNVEQSAAVEAAVVQLRAQLAHLNVSADVGRSIEVEAP